MVRILELGIRTSCKLGIRDTSSVGNGSRYRHSSCSTLEAVRTSSLGISPSNCKPIKSDCTRVSFESVTVGDKKCQGCAICNDPVCPALSCPVIPDGCTKAIQRWQTINGTKCPDCPDLTPCLPCPQFSCQAPKNCTETKQTTVMVNGKKCPGCPVCVVKCPVKKCAPLPKYCMCLISLPG